MLFFVCINNVCTRMFVHQLTLRDAPHKTGFELCENVDIPSDVDDEEKDEGTATFNPPVGMEAAASVSTTEASSLPKRK